MPELNRRTLFFGGLFLLAAVLGLYFLIPKLAGLNDTWGQLKQGDPVLLGVAGFSELLSIGAYALLFGSVFGRDVPRVDWRAAIQIPLAGIAAIRLLAAAGAGGVAVTAWAVRRAGMSASVIASRMVATYVLQYSVYLLALVVCGLGLHFGVFPGGGSVALTLLPALLSLGAIALVASMSFVPQDFQRRLDGVAQRRQDRLGKLAARLATVPQAVGDGVRTAIAMIREGRLAFVGAFFYWAFDIFVLGLALHAFGSHVQVAVLIMGYFLGTLGSLLPLPGGVGGVESGMIGAFLAFGVSDGRAIAGVLAYRAISFWLPTIPGVIGYLKLRSTVKRWHQEDEREGRMVLDADDEANTASMSAPTPAGLGSDSG